ncbi:hypothetical protein ACWD6I_23005, partial [Streptomyces sp. NPDC002454]
MDPTPAGDAPAPAAAGDWRVSPVPAAFRGDRRPASVRNLPNDSAVALRVPVDTERRGLRPCTT